MATENAQPTVAFQSLIDSVREDAVERAEEEANRILAKAEKQALRTIASAQEAADEIVEEAGREAEQFEASAKSALKRASRDVLIGLEARLVAQLDALLARDFREAMSGDQLAEILGRLAANWHHDDAGVELEALLNPSDLEKLKEGAIRRLADHLQDTALKPSSMVTGGLRIGVKNARSHYDFTAETLAELLGRLVEPQLREILRGAASEIGLEAEAREC